MWKEKKDETFTRAVRTINYIRAIALSLWKNCKLFFKDAKCLSKYSQNTISCIFYAKHLSRVQFLSSETEDANRTIQTNKSSVKWRWWWNHRMKEIWVEALKIKTKRAERGEMPSPMRSTWIVLGGLRGGYGNFWNRNVMEEARDEEVSFHAAILKQQV